MPLKVRADFGQLNQIREYVIESATALGVTPDVFDDLRLAVDEAVTNILTHGYGGPGDVELELIAEGPDLIVRLCDQAPSFDPALARPVDRRLPGERQDPGGFGLFLMRSAMDELVHRETGPGNELTMIKRGVVSATSKTDA